MSTPTPAPLSPAEQFRADVMALLDQMRGELEAMHEELDQIREGLAHAASQPQAAAAGSYRDFDASEIVLSYDDKGEATYKIKGIPFTKFGVRLWPETLPALGIDPASLKPGPNPCHARVRALMGEKGPRKIVGLAAGSAPANPVAVDRP